MFWKLEDKGKTIFNYFPGAGPRGTGDSVPALMPHYSKKENGAFY